MVFAWDRVFFSSRLQPLKYKTVNNPPLKSKKMPWLRYNLRLLSNCMFLDQRDSSPPPLKPSIGPIRNSRFCHIWWLLLVCWAINCVWWGSITSLSLRGQNQRYEPGPFIHWALIQKSIYKNNFYNMRGGRSQHLSCPKSWSCVVIFILTDNAENFGATISCCNRNIFGPFCISFWYLRM